MVPRDACHAGDAAVRPLAHKNNDGRVDVADTGQMSNGIAERYATAVFGLAKDDGSIDTLESDTDTLDAALTESEDLRELTRSPVYSRDEQGRAMAAVGEKLGLSDTMVNTLRLMAQKRRLFVLPAFLKRMRTLVADHKGVVTAEVTSAKPLTDAQREQLAKALSESAGRDVKLSTSVDGDLIGGLVVRMGSKMVDTSIRARLNALQTTMKEVR